MNTFDWDFDDHPTRGTDVRRRLMLDHRSYDVTAFDDGTGVVGLRLVGWDSGYVFTEFIAELPTGDATDVGQLLASALAGFRGGGSPPGSPAPGSTPSGGWQPYDRRPRERHPTATKAGQPWEPADLDLLVRRFREGATIKTLTVELGRTDGAIRQRLLILGEVRPAPPSGTGPAADGSAADTGLTAGGSAADTGPAADGSAADTGPAADESAPDTGPAADGSAAPAANGSATPPANGSAAGESAAPPATGSAAPPADGSAADTGPPAGGSAAEPRDAAEVAAKSAAAA